MPVKIDVDRQSDLANKWKATSVPHLVFIKLNKKVFARLKGYQPPSVLEYKLKEMKMAFDQLLKAVDLLKKDPNHPEGLLALGVALRLQNQFWKSKNNLEQALKEAQKRNRKDLELPIHYELTKVFIHIPNPYGYKQLVKHGEAVLKLDPKNTKGWTDETCLTLSLGYFHLKKIPKAYEVVAKLIHDYPKSKYLGQAYHFLGLYAY